MIALQQLRQQSEKVEKVYRNIQKVIQFLLVGNIAEITTLFVATIFNWDAPLLAVHILWVNLATASLPALALGVDPASKNIMKHKPVKTGTLFEKTLFGVLSVKNFRRLNDLNSLLDWRVVW